MIGLCSRTRLDRFSVIKKSTTLLERIFNFLPNIYLENLLGKFFNKSFDPKNQFEKLKKSKIFKNFKFV